MLLVRPLLYEEKTLDDFDIDNEDSLFYRFYNQLLKMDGTRVTDHDVEKNITSMFNDACYICTISLLIKRPELKLGYFRELTNQKRLMGTYYKTNEARADAVLSMVYFLLKYCPEGNTNTNKLMTVIDTHLRERSNDSYERYEDFNYSCQSISMLTPGFFNKRTITAAVLKKEAIKWHEITNNYGKDELTSLILFWKEPQQRNLIIDAIEEEVNNSVFIDDLPF